MKKTFLLAAALIMLAYPVLAKEYIVQEMSEPDMFMPDKLTIQPGDTVTFVDAQYAEHDVMFVEVPKGVDEMIMSPMLKKKGDKWSYKFTVPGTYNFHCHPHEHHGMVGTLIVGQASKPGETHLMDHHKMAKKMGTADDHHAAAMPQGTGKINSINAEKHTLNISHDAIKALGWPKMRMEFAVDKGVDLSALKAGDEIIFTLKPEKDDDYTIINVKKAK
jgi:plastocyanin